MSDQRVPDERVLLLLKNLMRLDAGITSCVEDKNTLCALILLYSAVDTAGWLNSESPMATRDSFMSWVRRYLLTAKGVDCTALDLYAARCGLLHTFTPDSALVSEGKARQICYAWGDADVDEMKTIIRRLGKTERAVAVHFDDLREAWRLGLIAFGQEMDADPELKSRVLTKAESFFRSMGKDTLARALDVTSPGANPIQS